MISLQNQRRIGVILQYVQMILSSAISLLYTPVILRILGQTEYGIYNVANSTIAYLSLLSLGIGASYIKFYSEYKKDEDREGIKKLNGLYLFVFLIIGLISLILGFIIAQNVGWFYNDGYSADDINIARILVQILSVNMALSFPASIFLSYVISQERFVFQKIVNILTTILAPASGLVFLYLGYGSIGMVLSTTFCSILSYFLNAFFCIKKLGMEFTFRKLNFSLLKDIFGFSIFIAINQLVDLINFQTDKLILSKIVNAAAVAVYAIGSTINTLYVGIAATISSVYVPEINRIVSEHKKDMDIKLNKIFVKVGRIQWFVTVLIISGFVFFGQHFIKLWAGEDYANSYYVALLLMIPITFMFIQAIGIEVQRAKRMHHIRSIIFLGMAIMNALITVWLASMWAEIGAALGTAITTIICCILINIFYHLKLGLNVLSFWKSILSTIPALIIPFGVGTVIMMFCTYNSIIKFILFIVIYALVYLVSVYFLGFNAIEKDSVRKVASKVVKRRIKK